MRPSADRQKGHDLLHLQTNKIITCKKFAPVPTDERCAKKDHSIAEDKGIPKGLKIKDRNDTFDFDSHCNAGVDCHCENQVSCEGNF